MKFFYAAALAAMLAVASAPNLRAQEPDQDKEKQKQQEEEKKKKSQPKPDDKTKPEPKPDKEKAKPDAEKRGQADAHTSQDRNSQRGNNASTKRIPDDRYHASFGREHHFRVARRNDGRFEYGGYAFEYVDAWPSGWSNDDDYYIALDGDDYYLVDVVHPELRIRVIIVG
jgi:hemolysin activation/secretion protein